ncbi:MAG: ester cyclase [Draconibacterium sp.]
MKKLNVILLAVILISTLTASAQSKKEISDAKKQLDEILSGIKQTENYLQKFDTLDFVVYSNQEWERLHESHAENILVYYPDGSTTVGLEDHIAALEPMFVFAPNTKITAHPIRFGSGQYTAVTGYIEGTFSDPMPIGEGKFIDPTGKSFKLPMVTIGLWKDGVMYEEHLFWDNMAFMKQIGLAN